MKKALSICMLVAANLVWANEDISEPLDIEYREADDVCYSAADISGLDEQYDEYVTHCTNKFAGKKFKLGEIASFEVVDEFTRACEGKATDDAGEINVDTFKSCMFQNLDTEVAKLVIKG